MAEVKLKKGVQGGRDSGAAIFATVLTAGLLRAVPELAEYADVLGVICGILAGAASRMLFNYRKHRKIERQGDAKRQGYVALVLISALMLTMGCARTPKKADAPYGTLSYGPRHGERVARGDDGAPLMIDGKVFKEAAPGYFAEIWLLDSGDEVGDWGGTMSKITDLGMTAVLSAVNPWAAVAMAGVNIFSNNPTMAAMSDFAIPSDVRANRVRLEISGQAVAAGWNTQGSDVEESAKAGGWPDLKTGAVCAWVFFDANTLKGIPADILRQITTCEKPGAPAPDVTEAQEMEAE